MGLFGFIKDLGKRLLNAGRGVVSKIIPLAQKILPVVSTAVGSLHPAAPFAMKGIESGLNFADTMLNSSTNKSTNRLNFDQNIDSPRLRLK